MKEAQAEMQGSAITDKKKVAQFITALAKARRNIPMYPVSHPMQEQVIDEFCQVIFPLLAMGSIHLRINQYDILFHDESIYHNRNRDESLALFFFRDGLRLLSFLQDITREEITSFLQIISMDYEREVIDDDIVTLLWEKDFQHITYVVDETCLSESGSFEHEATEKAKRASGNSSSIMAVYEQASKLESTSDMDIFPLTNESIQSIVQEVENDPPDKTDMLINMLFEMLRMAQEKYEYEIIASSMKQTLEYAMLNANLGAVNTLLYHVKDISRDTGSSDEVKQYALLADEYVNSEAFIRLFGDVIDKGIEFSDNLIQEFSSFIRIASIPHFILIIGELNRISARRTVIKILSDKGAKDIDLLAKGLSDKRWYVVRNIIFILRKIANESAMNHIIHMTDHYDSRVKKEALRALGEMGTESLLPVITESLNDRDQAVRIAACRAVGQIGTPKSKQLIIKYIQSKGFRDKNFAEKKEIFTILSRWKEKDVIDFLVRIMKKKALFKRAKNNETRAAAIHCLGHTGADNVLQVIEGITKSRNLDVLKKKNTRKT